MELDSAIGVISRWSSISDNKSYVFTGNRDEIDQYLQAVDQIQYSIISGSTAYDLNGVNSALQMAMFRLADEMCNILKIYCKSADNSDSSTSMTDSGSNSYVDDYVYCNALNEVVINDLRSIVERMKSAGYLRDCKTAYINNRKRCIDAIYLKLEIEKLSSEDGRKKQWGMLEQSIKVWMRSSKIYFRKVFAYEKQLSEKILLCDDDDDVECFLKIANDKAFELVEFVSNLISCIQISSERLFGILDLYKTLSDLVPQINKIFSSQSSESLRTKSAELVPKLADLACKTIKKFEKDLLGADQPPHADASADKIHGVCTYVMGYVVKLGQNNQTLMELSLLKPPSTAAAATAAAAAGGSDFPQQQNYKFLPFHVMWIITRLVSIVEDRAKLYKNASDISFNLMSNFFYIIQKINQNPQLKELIMLHEDEDCVNKLQQQLYSKFDQAKEQFLSFTLKKVLQALKSKNNSKTFNHEFGKLKINLGKLRVSDFQLLKDIRLSMEEKLVQPYSSLLQHSPDRDTMLSVEQLTTDINAFFLST